MRDAKYAAFDIQRVLERILLKGSIIVKKAYCNWARYKEFKAPMHEAAFELIEIPHVRMSGKNSADIRMVVDALDLCYTKAHVDTFVIISGDSDFSPLVSKLRENNKVVVGVGVKNSTSDLLTSSCDEFIYYDDLMRESEKQVKAKRKRPAAAPEERKSSTATRKNGWKGSIWSWRRPRTCHGERGEEEKVWGSMVKQALKRRKPGFSESYHGYKTFKHLLEDAKARGMLKLEYDKKSGGYIVKSAQLDE